MMILGPKATSPPANIPGAEVARVWGSTAIVPRPPTLALDRRVGIAEVEQDYPPDAAVVQADRCLKCNIQTVFNGDLCILCGGCVDVCPWNCFKMVRLDKIEGDQRLKDLVQARYGMPLEAFQEGSEVLSQGTAMIKDETRCVRCGLCAERCPTSAITMEAFSFEEELVHEESAGGIPERVRA